MIANPAQMASDSSGHRERDRGELNSTAKRGLIELKQAERMAMSMIF